MKRFAFYISGNSTRLCHFLKQAEDWMLSSTVLVISDAVISDQNLIDSLESHGVLLSVYNHKDLSGNTVKDRNRVLSDLIERDFNKYQIDYCFSFGSHILAGQLLESYKNRIVNFHPALLPMFPGRKALDQALDHGNVLLVGNTAHFVDSGMDTGPVIMQSVKPLRAMLKEDGTKDYNAILDMQIEMLDKLFHYLDNDLVYISETNDVYIEGADYVTGHIYPS